MFVISRKFSLFINNSQISRYFSVLLKLEIIILRMCIMIIVLSILQSVLFFFIIALVIFKAVVQPTNIYEYLFLFWIITS